MKKLLYIFAIIAMKSLVSCEKKSAVPSSTNTNVNRTSVDTLSGKIYQFAGILGVEGFSGDGGPATKAQLAGPVGVAADGAGNIYIADIENYRIRKINTKGIISTIAGNGSSGYSGDGGLATSAQLQGPTGIVVDASGNIYFSDQESNVVRKINTGGIISTIAGTGTGGFSGDGGLATAAQLNTPDGLAFDAAGNLYVADVSNGRIRKINTSGIILTVAGNAGTVLGDGGPATAAGLYTPFGVTVDGTGNIYIAEYNGNRIRKVNTSGIISTIAGNISWGYDGNGGFSGDGGIDTAAELNNPTDVKIDGSGNIYIADADNYRIRMINTSGIISTIVGNGTSGVTNGNGGLAVNARISLSEGITLDSKGNLYIAELYTNLVRIVYK